MTTTAEENKYTLTSHLLALRKTLLISAGAIAVAFLLLFYGLREPLVYFILDPVKQRGIPVIATAVSEALMMQFKICLVGALVVSMPIIIWQVWAFVAPALYPNEKRTVILLFLTTVLLFLIGLVFCYLLVFPLTIDLFWEASEGVATAMWSVQGYFNFVLSFILPFGLMFDLPVVIVVLARHGKVSYRGMSRNRKYVILGTSVVAAILTPPDVVSQIMLMLPLLLLYELSAQLTRLIKPKTPADQAGE